MANLITAMKNTQNFTYTENGAGTYQSTMSGVMDLFGLGAAYRTRDAADCIRLFDKAWAEDQTLALKCLFYLRDVRGGQGERRFFRVILHDLATTNPDVVRRNLDNISEYGRWDDLYCLIGTPVEGDMFDAIRNQLRLDMSCKTPSLLGKWLKSENASSNQTKKLAHMTKEALGLTSREYRKMLSKLRAKINIVERLMSENRWNEIQFDKIPSRAGFIYRNAFARRDIIKAKYEKFMTSDETKVNAKTLYPYEVIHEVMSKGGSWSWPSENSFSAIDRATLNKYWENLADIFKEYSFDGICVCDTSGSMTGTPIEVAVSIALYCAEKNSGPYHNHFISFSKSPKLHEVTGRDFVSKVCNLIKTDWDSNTNLEAVFDLLLDTAIKNHLSQDNIIKNIIIVTDMEFDACVNSYNSWSKYYQPINTETLMETIQKKWAAAGYILPNLVFWNVNARNDRIPMKIQNGISFVSGFSPSIFESIMKGKTAWDLVLDKLLSKRYEAVKF